MSRNCGGRTWFSQLPLQTTDIDVNSELVDINETLRGSRFRGYITLVRGIGMASVDQETHSISTVGNLYTKRPAVVGKC